MGKAAVKGTAYTFAYLLLLSPQAHDFYKQPLPQPSSSSLTCHKCF